MGSVEHLLSIAHSPIRNYAIPGLTSWLLGDSTPYGAIRMFTCERNHVEPITPHSHRFNFCCHVVRGQVTNRIWTESSDGDPYEVSTLRYNGAAGCYERAPTSITQLYCYSDHDYATGDWYGMQSAEIHSIYFRRNSVVVFYEGPLLENSSVILEPIINGITIPTFKVEPWMFQKETKSK